MLAKLKVEDLQGKLRSVKANTKYTIAPVGDVSNVAQIPTVEVTQLMFAIKTVSKYFNLKFEINVTSI